ncbi:selenocysteine-specific translation elongation factor [Candidatus Arthromitus sp. SFB-rat-Yit]|uniref:selenocysteine-specific translation elongation factor n=1 Tax=Candidatus Arthromitus sp. SFB-rat-Yit TaxID=1041504 RepID=UPI000227A3EC|nr:selenocysteine-specific translation elongation factor [Candidatus Arthromitus sp. SFB-rat-Yit]BAK80909.1 selenocysteine-specific translation elongation factor [Candidatus Arthromitus sp. SFB-rat-Yit]
MKNIILGTAGHIDHGKTSLIKYLTNIDTDSLEEEKRRGISINLGFAFFDLPCGSRVGVIDVPGHEKFIKNMIAGSVGIDIVLLVIACDEGVKPQTREHIDILNILNVNKGIVVLTKRDLVDDEWYDFIKNDIENELKGTFLKNSTIIGFSSKSGHGYDELINEIERLMRYDDYKRSHGIFRMSIDRCFSVSGFGTVITGTVISGKVCLNDSLFIYPLGIECKVRNIQVYEENKKEAFSGQRCAINLSSVKKEIKRGYVVSTNPTFDLSYIIDCKFYSVKNLDKNIINGQRIRFLHGTSEVIGRMYILDKHEIVKNSEAYVQIRLEKPVLCLKHDRYVIRMYSPMVTIGGGYVISALSKRVNGNNEKYLEEVKLKEKEVSEDYLSLLIEKDRNYIIDLNYICKNHLLIEDEILPKLDRLIDKGVLVCFFDGNSKYFIHKNNLNKIYSKIEEILTKYHSENKFRIGFLKEELREKLNFKGIKSKIYLLMLNYFENMGYINMTLKYISLSNFKIELSNDENKIINGIIDEYKSNKFIPPKIKDLENKFNCRDFMEIHHYLEEIGILYKINLQMYLLNEDFIFAKDEIINFIKRNGFIDLNLVKELLNSNRKYSVLLLEHLDELKITIRKDNKRILI